MWLHGEFTVKSSSSLGLLHMQTQFSWVAGAGAAVAGAGAGAAGAAAGAAGAAAGAAAAAAAATAASAMATTTTNIVIFFLFEGNMVILQYHL